MEQDNDVIQESISKFMPVQLTGVTASSHLIDGVEQLNNSIGNLMSDIVFAVTGVKTKPPKLIML